MRSTLYPLYIILCITFLSIQTASSQYCVDNLYFYGCNYGDNINDITVGNISQTNTGCGANGYSDYTNLTADFEQGSTNTLQVATASYYDYVSMWIDFNDDEVFATSEKLVSYMLCINAYTMYSANFIIPVTAQIGNHRMRVRCVQYNFPFDACTQYSSGEVHDYVANITPPVNMSFTSATTTQAVTDNVSLGSNDVEIIGIQVVTSGSLNPISATSFTLNSNGSTNYAADVTNTKIYYTGTDPDFSATNLFGSSAGLPATITGNQQLAPGVNYFWVAYDISTTGTIDNVVDAECTSVTVDGVAHTPTVTAPAGNRKLGYCIPVSLYGCYYAWIDGVQLNTLSNQVSGCNGNIDGYIEYAPSGNLTTSLQIGTSYPITVSGSPYTYEGLAVWIDFNNDGDFSDADEFVFSTPNTGLGDQSGTISIPNNNNYIGDHRMRVRATSNATISASQSCTQFYYSETEDYTITITASTPMVYVSSTTTQNNTTSVQKGTTGNEIIGIEVVTSGALNPFDVTSLDINSNGSTNFSADVTNVNVYYTGTSSTFATTTLFGSSTTLPATITGNVTLASGTNYFWVTYDVSSTATIGNVLDAECTQIVMTGNGGTQVPTVTAPAGSRKIDYCIPSDLYGCSSAFIDGVVLNSLDNQFSGCNGNAGAYIQYEPADYTTSLEQGGTYPIYLTGGSNYYYSYMGFGVWIDFNNDGDFSDAGEFAWSSPFIASGTQTGSITVPATATIGDHRMRIRSKYYGTFSSSESCAEAYNGESEDYTITITAQSNMTYVSSTTTQTNLDPVTAGQVDQDIIRIEVVTSGSLNPFSVLSIKINSNGSTDPADITNVKIYYTGTSAVFATATLFGSATDLSTPISGNQVLQGGTNYFWVAYDISPTATLGDFLDAECEYIVMSGAIGTKYPSVSAPPGNREINYCIGASTYGCSYSYINGVTLNTLVNTNTYCNGNANSYVEFPQSGNTTTQLELGQTYDIQLDGPNYYNYVGFGVWIDFNSNGSFDDAGEFVYSSPYLTYGSQYGSISLPCDDAFVGDHRMRVRSNYYTLVADSEACTTFYNGETEDYTITLSPASTNQVYTSSVCYQNNLTNVAAGTADAEIISIQISTTGCLAPLTVASFTLNSTGTTDFPNDVTNVKIYYTGTDPNFAPINLFGSATDLSVPITGTQTLNSGTNYFWVAYDISASATLGNFVDAGCSEIDITGQGTVTPINANPYGSREINICVPTMYSSCFYNGYINTVTLNTLSNTFSGCNGNANNYISYAPSGNLTTNLQAGLSYDITLVAAYSPLGFGVWIDYNNDSDFGDAGEFVYGSPSYGYTYTGTISIPIDPAFYGLRSMRVRGVSYTILGAGDYCNSNFYGGETEDYMITIDAPPACTGAPDPGTISADPIIVCGSGDVSLTLSGSTPAAGITFQWQSSADGNTWTDIPGATSSLYTASLSSSTYYQVIVTCTNSGIFATTSIYYAQVGGNEEITSTTGATICGEDSVAITATGNATFVMWYDSPSSVVPLYYSSSPSTYTPFVSTTTTYYAAAANGEINSGHVGPTSDSIGNVVTYYTYVGEYFNVYKPCIITGVYVYPASAGNVILRLEQNYNQLAIDTLVVTAAQINQKTFVPLNFAVDVGTNYVLRQYGGVNLHSNDYNFAGYPYPYTLDDVISITQSSYGTYYYFNVYDWVISYNTLCESAKTPVTVTVTPSPEITVTSNPANPTICAGSGQSVSVTATGPYTSYTWSPAAGLSSTTGSTVTATPTVTTQYVVKGSDGTCVNYDTILVTVIAAPALTVTATPDSVCAGGSSQLSASSPATGYTVSSIPFAPDATIGGTILPMADNQVTNYLPIGFTFNFYGNNYSEFSLSSNGWLSFDYQLYPDYGYAQLLPDPAIPNNLIAFSWEDLNPSSGGTVRYYTTGTAPSRKCVIEFKDVNHAYTYYVGDPVTVQVILYESTNIIDIVTTMMNGNPNGYWAPHTEGIENSTGTEALTVPGRNQDATWTATNDAWRFAPTQYSYLWSPAATLDNAAIAGPIASPNATTTYTVSVSDSFGCETSTQITVSVVTTPDAGTITPDLIDFCGSGSTELELIDFSPGASIQWQQSATSGGPYTDIPGATGSTYTTDSLNSTTYYIATVSCANSGVSAEASVQISEAPDPPTGINGFNCGPGVVVLEATGSGGQLNWYYSQNGNYIGSGTPFTTPFINQTTTFYVQEGGPPDPPLSTTFSGSSIANGNMFDITALNDLYITGFDINMSQSYTSDFEIYYKVGTYVGSEYQPQNWTLLGVAPSVQGLGSGSITPLPITLYLPVEAGQTIGIYITASYYGAYVNFTPGTSIGNVYVQDNNLQVKEGTYAYYPFSAGYGPYVWNGRVHYVAPGCSSSLTPVVAEITAPQVAAFASSSTVCEGDQITLTAVNYGQQNFNYEWMPQISGMLPQNGLDDTVTVTPLVTMTFTVSITDPNAPLCDTTIVVPITVDNTPSSVFIGNLDPQYHNDDLSVTLTGVPPGGTFSGPGMNGDVFSPGSLAVGTYVITYTYTDANGCTGTAEQTVEILPSVGIGNVEVDKNISIFPNPSEGIFNMSLKLPFSVQSVIVTVYDQIGREVKSLDYGFVKGELLTTFDFSKKAKGEYYVTINVDGDIFYRRVTVQ